MSRVEHHPPIAVAIEGRASSVAAAFGVGAKAKQGDSTFVDEIFGLAFDANSPKQSAKAVNFGTRSWR